MTFTEREKGLLCLLGICIAFFLFHRFVYLPKADLLNALDADIERDRQTVQRLEQAIEAGGDPDVSIEAFKLRMREMDRILPAGVHQEEVILYLEKMLARHDLEVFNLSFAANLPVHDAQAPPEGDAIDELILDYENGRKVGSLEESRNPSGNADGRGEAPSEEPAARQFDVTLSFTGAYADVKAFVDELENNPRLIGIQTIGMTLEAGRIQGVMTIGFPFYGDGAADPPKWEIDGDYGRSSPFSDPRPGASSTKPSGSL